MGRKTAGGSRRRRGRSSRSGAPTTTPAPPPPPPPPAHAEQARRAAGGYDIAEPVEQGGDDDVAAAHTPATDPVPEPAQPADASHPPAEFNPLRHPILFDTPQLLSIDSTWVGHVPLAYLMIDLLRPRVLVELGTHHGDSYCAFCQAVAALESPTRCVAVDTWAGDEQTGPYDERIFAALKAHHDPLYGSFSTLMRAEFDEALAEFEDGSIDLLHFDGPPTYEAAKHAYDTWLPKMSERGVMLFHDVVERHEPGFGAWRAWEVISWKHPSFELTHAHGLGIVAVGPSAPAEVLAFLDYANDNAAVVRQFFAEMGERMVDLQVLLRTTHWLEAQWKVLSHWRQMTRQPGLPRFSVAESFGDPEPLARALVEEVARLAQDDLELREPAPPPQSPAEQ